MPTKISQFTTAGALTGTETVTGLQNGDNRNFPHPLNELASTDSGKGATLVGFIRAGIGAVTRTVMAKLREYPSVTDYGVTMDGVDSTVAYQAALDAELILYVPPGTLLTGVVNYRTGHTLIGPSGNAVTIKTKDSLNTTPHLIASKNDIEFRNITFDGNKANNSAGNVVLISGTSARVRFLNCHVKDGKDGGVAATSGTSVIEFLHGSIKTCGTDGFQMTTVDRSALMFSTLSGNGRYGAVWGSACTNSRDFGNNYHDNVQGGSVMVGGNDAIRMGNIADTNGTGHGLQYNDVERGLYLGNISKGNGISGLDFTLGSSYGAAVGNISFDNDVRGLEIDSESYYVAATGNVVYRNGEVGVSVYRSPTTILVGNHSLENGVTTAPRYGFRFWDDAVTLPSANCIMIGNNGSDDRGGSATQTHGLSLENNATLVALLGNKLSPNVTAATNTVSAAGVQNAGEGNLGLDIPSTALTLAAGWVEYDAAWLPAQYHKDAAGVVKVTGAIKSGTVTAGTVIATLPAGFRPAEVAGPFVCYGEAGAVSFYVLADGSITANSALNATRTGLSGIEFRVQ